MFTLAIIIGIYSYVIFSLGLLGILYKQNIIIISIAYLFIILFFIIPKVNLSSFKKEIIGYIKTSSKLGLIFLSLIAMQSVINLIGTLGPELGFDALWYHLTIPKIYLDNHSIFYIPGGLFYYSTMPKLTEMLYAVALAFGSEIFAKLIHFSFGILCLVAIYKVARKFLSKEFSLLVLVLFYSNLVVGWMSITAYVDLARTFFEIMALWGFINWVEKKDRKWFIESAVMLGLAISTKLLSLGSLLIFSVLIAYCFWIWKKNFKHLFIGLSVYWFICLLIPLPWFVFSFIHTGNPIYPFFTEIYPVSLNFQVINPFFHKSDSISLIYILLLAVPFVFKKLDIKLKLISFYSIFALLIWFLTPKTDGGRFILPYLPAFSILVIGVIREIRVIKIQYIIIGVVILMSLFSLIYRFGANLKYIPVILGVESKNHFLSSHLNFSFGDFYDTDSYFAKKIKQDDTVLLYGFHNLYYVNFPFTDSSFVKKGDVFNYVAVQGNNVPLRFKFWNLIYYNKVTNVKLYSIGGQKWVY